ncbi:uncharacterized protein LOC107865551 [Capsicum annuum]|uniref:uncharacterized protein LOC107865551 n=1 Tax=Capsicum annuum TaxID=4072 RepID=UPI001FB0B7A8|nr:uncharacterized protein LOC107865551 [Capsicum annuum]
MAAPLLLSSGRACKWYDIEGREYLNLTSGIAVNALGHGDPDWINVVTQQANVLTHVSNIYYSLTQDKFKPDVPYSLDMVLQDSKGDRMHASIGKYDIKFFKNKMEELELYRINNFVVTSNFKKFKITTHKHRLIFIKMTSVEKITDPSFPMDILNLCPFDQLTIHHIVDDTKLFDVVGQNVTYEAVQTFKQGDNVYSVCSCWYQTKLWINPSLPQSIAFKSRLNATCASNYERLSQTSSQQCYSIMDELTKGIVPFKYINDLIVCLEEASYWIAAKIVCFDLDHGWSYMTCNKCIIKVEQDENSFFVQNAIQRYRLQVRVMDETGLITLLLWNREAVQLMGKTAKELKEDLIDDDECSYPSELDDIVEKKTQV